MLCILSSRLIILFYSGFWSGRRVLLIYQTILTAALAGVVYIVFICLITVNSFRNANNLLNAGQSAPFSSTEQYLSNRFNLFFFGAVYGTCKNTGFDFFWTFVNSQCQAPINQQTCQKCYDFSIASCVADPSQCTTEGNGNSNPSNIGCPYTYCRSGILNLLIKNIK